jgi:hypothetical protein
LPPRRLTITTAAAPISAATTAIATQAHPDRPDDEVGATSAVDGAVEAAVEGAADAAVAVDGVTGADEVEFPEELAGAELVGSAELLVDGAGAASLKRTSPCTGWPSADTTR